MNNFLKLLVTLVTAQAAGLIGSLFTVSAITEWYAYLTRPELSPPNWVFGPVWTTLYVLMGIAAFLVWKQGIEKKEVKIALGIYAVQLVLNALWSIIFFGLRSPGLALIEVALLWLSIVATMVAFHKVSRTATWLLVPYLLWVSFASYLNAMIYLLN